MDVETALVKLCSGSRRGLDLAHGTHATWRTRSLRGAVRVSKPWVSEGICVAAHFGVFLGGETTCLDVSLHLR